MRIKRIRSRNYRSLEDVDVGIDRSYCAISGKNNSGKSALTGIITRLIRGPEEYRPWRMSGMQVDFKEDKTQWAKDAQEVSISIDLEFTSDDDRAVVSYIERVGEIKEPMDSAVVTLSHTCTAEGKRTISAQLQGHDLDEKSRKFIADKIQQSHLLYVHNSTTSLDAFWYGHRPRSFYEIVLNDDENKKVQEATRALNSRLRSVAREHKAELTALLGKLSDKYDVNFSSIEPEGTNNIPFVISLSDKNVEVPLDDWGSGTQNRTHILMSILKANRGRQNQDDLERITPVVVIEEPESFLHPSAQAEFGKALRALSVELGIQIIVTTHCPYMLNVDNPPANILLKRRVKRKKLQRTEIVELGSDDWMRPFSEQLGVSSSEFNQWRGVFTAPRTRVLLVEGEIDKGYIELMREKGIGSERLNDQVEVVAYGGKDSLKNTKLLSFILSKFDRVFVTYDLDADSDVRRGLETLGLKEGVDFLPIGLKQPGKDCIEGLLPKRIVSAVFAEHTDLVMQATSGSGQERKKAKDRLKALCFQSFSECPDVTNDEVKEIAKMIKSVNRNIMR